MIGMIPIVDMVDWNSQSVETQPCIDSEVSQVCGSIIENIPICLIGMITIEEMVDLNYSTYSKIRFALNNKVAIYVPIPEQNNSDR